MLTALFLLAIAIGAAAIARYWPPAAAGAVVLAAWAATTLPDLDMALGLGHRSGLTHSVLPAGLACLSRKGRAVAAGLALGIGLHLSADLFPNAMRGFATVKLPLAGSIGAEASYLWFAVNGLAALVAGAWLLGRVTGPKLAPIVLGLVAILGIAYLCSTDGGWWALAMFGGTGWLALQKRRAPSLY